MRSRALRRAAGLAVAASLVVVGAVAADTLVADGDALAPGPQSVVDLGSVEPGAQLDVPVAFVLTCSGTSHLDQGQVVSLAPFGGATVPTGGTATIVGTSFVAPVGWPADGATCATPAQTAPVAPAAVALTAPSIAGGPYEYVVLFRATSPSSLAGIAGFVEVRIRLSVGIDDPPVLDLPADVTVTTEDPAGALIGFAAVAIDAEDEPDPAVVCSPPSGSWFPVGTTEVECRAQDGAGQVVVGGFTVTVRYEAPVIVRFEAPIRPGAEVVLPAARTLPVKVHLERAGQPIRQGKVEVVPAACPDGSARSAPTPLTLSGGRWTANLRTGELAGCSRVDLRLDGRVVGGFGLAEIAAGPASGGRPAR
jgi:hypothetical protein